MIWRPRYKDHVVEHPKLTPIEAANLADGTFCLFPLRALTIGSFSLQGGSELALWRRLLRSAIDQPVTSLWLGVEQEFVAQSVPKSILHLTFVSQHLTWRDELGALASELTFAVFSKPNGDSLAFLGLPTEDGLDRIAAFYNI